MQTLLSRNKLSVVRVGRASTVAPALRGHCLEALIEKTPGVREVRTKLLLSDNAAGSAQQGLWAELGEQRQKATAAILRQADVVVTSLVGSGHEALAAAMRQHGVFMCVSCMRQHGVFMCVSCLY